MQSPSATSPAHVDRGGAAHLSPCLVGKAEGLFIFHPPQLSTQRSPALLSAVAAPPRRALLLLGLHLRIGSMAMWRAAARHLVDRAIGSRASHVRLQDPPTVGSFLFHRGLCGPLLAADSSRGWSIHRGSREPKPQERAQLQFCIFSSACVGNNWAGEFRGAWISTPWREILCLSSYVKFKYLTASFVTTRSIVCCVNFEC